MPTFVSNKGVWYPAKEKIGLVYKGKKSIPKDKLSKSIVINGDVLRPGDPFIYDGADRAALQMLQEEGVETLGKDFRRDPEFLQAVRNMGFNSVLEYLKHIGYDDEAEEKKFQEKAAQVEAHEIPARVEEIEVMGGGKDFAGGGNDIIGGFGEERLRPAKELKK